MPEKKAVPKKASMGHTYVTHGPEFSLKDMAAHSRLTPQAAREQLHALINAIPDSELHNFVAGQVTVIL